jgi:hypothetical protein
MKSVYIICDSNDEPIGLGGGKYEMCYAFTSSKLAEAHIEKGQKVNKFKLMREK